MNEESRRRSRFKRLQRMSWRDLPALTILRARRFLAVYPDHGAAWCILGIALVELARYEEAETALMTALELCPMVKKDIPLSHLGHLFRARGNFPRAVEWYRQAIAADPDDATGY